MQRGNKLDQRRVINMIRVENNSMAIRHNRYYMFSEAHRQDKEANMELDPTVIV